MRIFASFSRPNVFFVLKSSWKKIPPEIGIFFKFKIPEVWFRARIFCIAHNDLSIAEGGES